MGGTAHGVMAVPILEGLRLPHTDTAGALIDEIAGVVRDPSFTGADILRLLNRGLLEIAGRVRLPDLETTAVVETRPDRPYTALPADYHGRLQAVLSLPERRRLVLEESLEALERNAPSPKRRGGAAAVAVSGSRLHYRPAPAGRRSLELLYWRLPPPLAAATDKAACLPAHLAGPLLVNYACRELFERIEEGADGRKTQTERCGERFERAMADLAAFVGPRPEPAVEVRDDMGVWRGLHGGAAW